MEPKDPVAVSRYDEFEYDLVDDESNDLEQMYGYVVRAVNDFFKYYAVDGERSKDDFYDLMREVTPSRAPLHVAMAAREVNAVLNGITIEKSDSWVLNETWYDSFIQCVHIAERTNGMSAEELQELRKLAYRKMTEVVDGQHSKDVGFGNYANALNWYSHVIFGTTVMLGETSEEAVAWFNEEIAANHAGQRAMERFELAGHNLFSDKVQIYGDTEKIRPGARYVAEGLEEDAEVAAKAFIDISYFNVLRNELLRCSEQYTASWQSFVAMARDFAAKEEMSETEAEETLSGVVEDVDLEKFKPLEVDWEVLPPGKLQDAAREIVGTVNDLGHEVVIDPERLKALELIRTQWGTDKCYYAKGALKSRRVRHEADKQCPDQFILLVLQDKDDDGHMIEHVVAESPIAGPHAMYLFRQDVNPTAHWRTVMAMDKNDARKQGARPIKHPRLDDKSELPAVMAERVSTLLTATPEEFTKLEFRRGGFIIRRTLAIKAFQALRAEAN
jgi:hypothetical protein